jgi:hypothetical protein
MLELFCGEIRVNNDIVLHGAVAPWENIHINRREE